MLTGSLGIAVYDGDRARAHEDLLKKAEIAMYRAKRGGADRIEIFRPEMRGDRDERVALESDLRKALEKNQLKVLYQPIIYLPTEELAGFEALVRWDHPKLGVMNPARLRAGRRGFRSHRQARLARADARRARRRALAEGASAAEQSAVRLASTSRAASSSARI